VKKWMEVRTAARLEMDTEGPERDAFRMLMDVFGVDAGSMEELDPRCDGSEKMSTEGSRSGRSEDDEEMMVAPKTKGRDGDVKLDRESEAYKKALRGGKTKLTWKVPLLVVEDRQDEKGVAQGRGAGLRGGDRLLDAEVEREAFAWIPEKEEDERRKAGGSLREAIPLRPATGQGLEAHDEKLPRHSGLTVRYRDRTAEIMGPPGNGQSWGRRPAGGAWELMLRVSPLRSDEEVPGSRGVLAARQMQVGYGSHLEWEEQDYLEYGSEAERYCRNCLHLCDVYWGKILGPLRWETKDCGLVLR